MQKYLVFALFLVAQPWQSSADTLFSENCSSIISYIRNQELTFDDIVSTSYDSDIQNFKSVLNFVQNCPKEARSSAYEAIFKAMDENDDLWSSEGFELAYIISQFDRAWPLASQFPETIYNLHFSASPNCLLKSVEFDEYYYAADSYYGYDSRRRNNFCWADGTASSQSVYDVRALSSDVFTLRNTYYDEYLYADEAQYAHSTEKRRVFCFRKKQIRPVGSEWKFEPKNGTQNIIKLRNTHYDEVLFADGDVKYDKSRREVFTERLDGAAAEGWTLWSLEC